MARLAVVTAAAAAIAFSMSAAAAAADLHAASRPNYYHHPGVITAPLVHGGSGGHAAPSALPVVVLPAEADLPVVVLPAASDPPAVVLPAESDDPAVGLPDATGAPGAVVLPDKTATPRPKPSTAPVPTALPTAEEELPEEMAAPRPTACVPAVRNGVLCPCANGRLNCAAATATPAPVIDVDAIDVSDGSGADKKGDTGGSAPAVPRPTACVPAVRNGVTCPCAGGRLNCAAATAAPSATSGPTATATAAQTAAAAVQTAAPTAAVVVKTAPPTAAVVVKTAPPTASADVCIACDAPVAVTTHVPCVKKRLVFGCASSHWFVGHGAGAAQGVRTHGCARWVTVQATCAETKMVDTCTEVPCAALQ